ncbi:hypothetical protein L6452_45163 [Arctium lappa]|nr:hypothetical protein L6452_45163 [Arctium lappa]
MKNVAKCDTWCELQNPVNHRVFERKLRPKPFGPRARLPGRHASRRPRPRLPSGDACRLGRRLVSPCPWCGWPKKESPLTDARLVVVVKAFVSSRADAREALSNDPNVSSCNDASDRDPSLQSGGKFRPRLNTGRETDSKQVPWRGKDEKDS